MTQTNTISANMTATQYSKTEIAAMREWLTDCQWDDESANSIKDMQDSVIVRAVKRHYDGGIAQFLIDINY